MLLTHTSTPQILHQIESLQPSHDDVILLLLSEDGPFDIPLLIDELNQRNISFMGGIFPELVYGNQQVGTGCIIKKFKALMAPFCVSNITSSHLTGLPDFDATETLEQGTTIVLFDGLTQNINHFLEKLNDLLGEQCSFIGGGAGFISLQQQPCVFNHEGLKEDAAVVCVIDKRVNLGVRHGWEPLAGPLVATQTDGNTIVQLNWQNALEVYNKIVETDSGVALHQANFAGIAQCYPFGILREKEDDIVRDPLAIGENGAIVCIGEVPAHTVLHVLKGNPSTLLAAAQQAISDCSGEPGFPIAAAGTFVVDCITRALFLGDQFTEELNIIRNSLVVDTESQEPFGVLSLGEISSYGDGLLELFNKTIVIGTFHR